MEIIQATVSDEDRNHLFIERVQTDTIRDELREILRELRAELTVIRGRLDSVEDLITRNSNLERKLSDL